MPKDLGLRGGIEECKEFDTRVYVLRCKPRYENGPFTWYVGSARKRNLQARVRAEMQQTEAAADFCKRNKPLCIEFIWPVASPAAEAHVYYALLERLGAEAAAKGRVGGWTQTQAAPDRFAQLLIERDRRMLTGYCLGCGEDHKVRRCKNPPDTCPLLCGHCRATLRITSRGFMTDVEAPKASPIQPSVAVPSRPAPVGGGQAYASLPQKRSTAFATESTAHVAPHPFKRVKVCGQEYSTLMWFTGGRQPGPKVRGRVYRTYGHNALALSNGDSKTLEAAGFAGPKGEELLPGRTYLPSQPKETACRRAKKGGAVQIHRPGEAHVGRGYLWLVSDLQCIAALGQRSSSGA